MTCSPSGCWSGRNRHRDNRALHGAYGDKQFITIRKPDRVVSSEIVFQDGSLVCIGCVYNFLSNRAYVREIVKNGGKSGMRLGKG